MTQPGRFAPVKTQSFARQTMQQARGRHDLATAAMSLTYRSDAAFSDDGRINLTDTSAQTPISTSQTTSGTQG
jgi:hypothetical protein